MIVTSIALLLAGAGDPAVVPAEKPKLICKSIALTGTRLGGGKRECRTKEGWLLIQRQTESDTREMTESTNVRFPSQ